jgi:hypothetical protein
VVQSLEQTQAEAEEPTPARDSGWRDKREPVNALRLVRRQFGRHEPAERMTHEIDPLELHRLEPATEPGRQLGRADVPPQPRQVRHVDASTLCQ